ncbi:SDR family oxidoreductase [Acrocarpospora phusangensis]|uniref:SDR family oxidoreductase n=1 Tax=Acrocarpospora phusangensis TaxID=1070424 RepID=UPI001950396E|nr:SDR family oxidoreductase [Acrocarpospora phusangensis]
MTGATSGIGAATARRLARDGAAVAVLGRRDDRLKELAYEIEGHALPVVVDVTDRAAMERVAPLIREDLGRVDVVVANAGVMLPAPYEEAAVEEWESMIATNVNGVLYTGRAFAADLLAAAAEGRPADLVHVGSIGGHNVFPNYAVYGATKAAVAHLTRNLRTEFGPRGVRVRTIEPGLVATELGEDMRDEAQREHLARWRADVPPLESEDIADVIAYTVAAPARMNVARVEVLPTRQG